MAEPKLPLVEQPPGHPQPVETADDTSSLHAEIPTWGDEMGEDDEVLFDLTDSFEGFGSEEGDEEPVAAQPAPRDDSDVRARLQQAEEELARLRSQPPPQPAPFDTQGFARSFAQALQQQAQPTGPQLPPMPQIDKERLLNDPDAASGYLTAMAQWGYQAAVSQLSPHLQAHRAELDAMRSAIPLVEGLARQAAAQRIVELGIAPDAGQAVDLLNVTTRDLIDTDPRGPMWRLNPEVLVTAAQAHRARYGGQVRQPATPPAGQDGAPARQRSSNGNSARAVTSGLNFASQALGLKFDKKDQEAFARHLQGAIR